jgi:hypothetical protein
MKFALPLVAALTLIASNHTHAQQRNFLSKVEVDAAFGGKTLLIERKSDGQKFRWDLKADGTLYTRNLTIAGVRPTTFSGIWAVRENGALCLKWHDSPGEICPRTSKEGDKSILVGRRDDKEFVFAEVLSVE